mmetsp:Transcript_1349/g.3086  ORF Transcript_1349/g.3086 Transcript_1349/m.3086 type:complete len:246 (+) Transcript_1349:1211-1948(+)
MRCPVEFTTQMYSLPVSSSKKDSSWLKISPRWFASAANETFELVRELELAWPLAFAALTALALAVADEASAARLFRISSCRAIFSYSKSGNMDTYAGPSPVRKTLPCGRGLFLLSFCMPMYPAWNFCMPMYPSRHLLGFVWPWAWICFTWNGIICPGPSVDLAVTTAPSSSLSSSSGFLFMPSSASPDKMSSGWSRPRSTVVLFALEEVDLVFDGILDAAEEDAAAAASACRSSCSIAIRSRSSC